MRKLALCLFYALCTFTIAFSLFWMALPRLTSLSPAPQDEADSVPLSLAAQALPERTALYYLCDEGGMLTVYACGADGQPADLSVYSETELRTVLEDLGE